MFHCLAFESVHMKSDEVGFFDIHFCIYIMCTTVYIYKIVYIHFLYCYSIYLYIL